MIDYIQSVWTFFDPELFAIGQASVIAAWFAGWTIGLLADLLRKS